jgi:hypothetical protein
VGVDGNLASGFFADSTSFSKSAAKAWRCSEKRCNLLAYSVASAKCFLWYAFRISRFVLWVGCVEEHKDVLVVVAELEYVAVVVLPELAVVATVDLLEEDLVPEVPVYLVRELVEVWVREDGFVDPVSVAV